MIKNINIVKVIFIFLFSLSFISNSTAIEVDPFKYFNVYSLHDIGSSSDLYNTDVQGTTGAAGKAYLGMTIGASNINEYGLHTGGDVYIQNGSANGKLDIGGNATIRNFAIKAGVNAGGNVTLATSTSGTGTVNAAGTVIKENPWSSIPANSGVPYTPMFDYEALNRYFLDASSDIGRMATTGNAVSSWGNLYINSGSGVNVFNIDAALLDASNSIVINGPADAVVYINVTEADTDHTASLTGSTPFTYSGNISKNNVVLNYPTTERLNITSGMTINILAPLADTYFTTGLVKGNLITGNLYGGAQVNYGYFDYNPPADNNPVPEPATIVLLGSGAAGLLGFRKKFKK